ncbi:hypothetical protein BJY00DRAFT_312842 [Aspergillus carlsbadensis]|nr:hypothetical protein BJY00DRAFT_312842 [Aspergillus carlsbadensis]
MPHGMNLIPVTLISRTAWACCFEFDFPIYVSLSAPRFKVPEFTNSYESTASLIGSISHSVNGSALAGGAGHIDRSHKIHFQYCEPKSKYAHGHYNKNHTLQILSHGLGVDSSYWDFSGENYNYIVAADAAGYATLNDNWLGVGKSEHADPYIDVQLGTQIEILKRVTNLVLSGFLLKQIPVFGKIVHVDIAKAP